MQEGGKKIVVLSGPSGSGKNSVLRGVVAECSSCVRLVTATTRAPRENEVHGKDHYFLSKEAFLAGIEDGTIPEHWHATETDRYYGTYLPDLEQKLAAGHTVVTEVQVEGMRFMKKMFGALTIFITAESIDELEKRIRSRQPHIAAAELQERLAQAEKEIREYAPEYDHTLINAHGKLDDTIHQVMDIMSKEQYL